METALDKAFAQVERKDFVPIEFKPLAGIDEALPIGWGQTISQPYTVRFMLEKLRPKAGDKILDIGSGSGWTTALLAHVVGEEGRVVALELIPQLAEFGKKNIAKYNFIKKGIARVLCENAAQGYEEEAPYNAILASASLGKKQLPSSWKQQLNIGGRIVAPIQNSIWLFTKINEHTFTEQEYPGFAFVPFVE